MSIQWSIVLVPLALALPAPAQTSHLVPCTQADGLYHCDRSALVSALAAARTISIETEPYDRNGQRELRELVARLGKTVAPAHGDLTLRLERIQPENSITFGPNSRARALLRVSSGGALIWVETFVGQPDIPWPTVVYDTIQQFRSRLKAAAQGH